MRRLAFFLALALLTWSRVEAADPQPMATEPVTAMSLVRRALDAELAGHREERGALLRRAIELAPLYAPARWHNGELLSESWQPLREAQAEFSADRGLKEYRQLRDSADGSVASHATLARFSRKQKWRDREEFHWQCVLRLEPGNRDAADALRLQRYQGVWLTADAAAQQKRLDQRTQANLKHWRPIFAAAREALEGHDSLKRSAALQTVRQVREPAALPALALTLPSASETYILAAIEALANIEEQAATNMLTWQALASQHDAVRLAAIDALRTRPWHAFVPTLMGHLHSPQELTYQATSARAHQFTVVRDTPFAETTTTYTFPHPYGRARLLNAQVRTTNGIQQWQNERVFAVLEKTTHQKLPRQPQAWWEWWIEYNELYICKYKVISSQRTVSCFVAGTLVWTETGLERIETLRSGDRVLSQHPDTGELAFRVIRDTTVRPASPTLRVQVNNEAIVATRGHPFWVSGSGWRMTKQLAGDERVHSLEGSLPIKQIEQGPECEAYNLVVDGFGTYFVGKAGLLVRDNHLGEVLKTPLPGYQIVTDSSKALP